MALPGTSGGAVVVWRPRMAKTYRERLLDPRWQKRRLEVLDERGWKCENCGATEDTLHVHHGYYERGLDPWEYGDEYLHVLCDGCHSKTHALMAAIQKELGAMPVKELATFCLLYVRDKEADHAR
jgi:hypothetical protein